MSATSVETSLTNLLDLMLWLQIHHGLLLAAYHIMPPGTEKETDNHLGKKQWKEITLRACFIEITVKSTLTTSNSHQHHHCGYPHECSFLIGDSSTEMTYNDCWRQAMPSPPDNKIDDNSEKKWRMDALLSTNHSCIQTMIWIIPQIWTIDLMFFVSFFFQFPH